MAKTKNTKLAVLGSLAVIREYSFDLQTRYPERSRYTPEWGRKKIGLPTTPLHRVMDKAAQKYCGLGLNEPASSGVAPLTGGRAGARSNALKRQREDTSRQPADRREMLAQGTDR